VREGLLVAWIPPGSIVPASYGEKELFVLEARDLRGEVSNGMLASPAELGMNDDHAGILELKEGVEPGTVFKNLYDLDDTIIEIENKMFTHRPDGFGHLGVAREIAGIQHKAFKSPEWYSQPVTSTEEKSNQIAQRVQDDTASGLSVAIQDGDLCPRFGQEFFHM
jgi:phenylalanyl-tRNA synthetase beta chain